MPSIDKYRLLPQIEELHILVTEMDDRLCEVMTACPTVEALEKEELNTLSLSWEIKLLTMENSKRHKAVANARLF